MTPTKWESCLLLPTLPDSSRAYQYCCLHADYTMENALTLTFNNQTVRAFHPDSEEVWFVVRDVATAIGLQGHSAVNVLLRHVNEDEKQQVRLRDTTGTRSQDTWVAKEGGVYCAVIRSNVPGAEPFRRWVCYEVIPSIRRQGKYELQQRVEHQQQQIEDLQTTLSRVRPLTGVKPNETLVLLSTRVMELYPQLTPVWKAVVQDGYIVDGARVKHPSEKKLTCRMRSISSFISARLQKDHKPLPEIYRVTRRNYYTRRFMEETGDSYVRSYVSIYPFHTWDVKLNWLGLNLKWLD
jgi:prophage antirepressor-like protein